MPLLKLPGSLARASGASVGETLREAEVLAAAATAGAGLGGGSDGMGALELPAAAGPIVLRKGRRVELTPVLAEADDPAASAVEMPRVRIETLRAAFPLREGRFALTEAELGPPCVTAGGAKKIKKDKKAKKEKKAAKKAAKLARQQAGAEMTATLNTAGEPSLNSSQPPAAGGALGKRGRDDAGSGAGGDGDAVDSKRRRA